MSAATTRTLVTGGAGFIGRYVVERLVAQGHRVRSLGRTPSPEIAALGVETVQGDLADREAVIRACDGVDEVHHIAACVELWHDPGELSRTNVDGTRHLLDAIAKFRASSDLREIFGDAFVDLYSDVKAGEHDAYQQVISPWERQHLLLNV